MLYVLLAINNILNKVILWLATIIVALMVLALSLSALTRYVSGIGYDWFIELPPVLTSWLVFPLLGPLLVQGKHIKVDFLTSILSDKRKIILRMFVASIPALQKITPAIKATEATNILKNILLLSERILVKKSTFICLPRTRRGPNNGKTNQLVSTGGNSINQS